MGYTGREYLLFLKCFLRGSVPKDNSLETRKQLMPFSSLGSSHKYRNGCGRQHSTHTGCWTCLHQVPYSCPLAGLSLCVKLSSVPVWQVQSQKSSRSPCLQHFPRPGLPVLVEQVSFHEQTRANLVKIHYLLTKDQRLLRAGNNSLCRQLIWRVNWPKHNKRTYWTNNSNTPWSARIWTL